MNITELLQFIVLGFAVGILSGMIGVGGGVVLVPALVLLFGWQQHVAQGTTLAMLTLPVLLLGTMEYYKAGNVNIKVALLMGFGLFLGSYLGGNLANKISGDMLKRIFGVALLLISLKMIIGK
jgi:uncharacterized membrane protein YfcA